MLIGIDTGGTFTDAVVYDEAEGVLATAKARTRPDLAIGIAESLDAVLAEAARTGSGPDGPEGISLVSLSTTLATNALVEGVGGRIALVFIGYSEAELDRGGLREALGDSPVILVDGGHDSMGVEATPLDIDEVVARAKGSRSTPSQWPASSACAIPSTSCGCATPCWTWASRWLAATSCRPS